MNWKFLPAALLGALMVLGGCSSSRVDPASKSKPATDSADMMVLKKDNDALHADLQQSQKQIDALTKQLAADREEQKRFREMMSTNFDLLEQSVSMTLSKSIDKGPGTPPAGPAGGTPAPTNDEGSRTTAISTARPAPVAPAALTPARPAAAAMAASPSGMTPLLVPGGSSEEVRLPSPKADARLTAQAEPQARVTRPAAPGMQPAPRASLPVAVNAPTKAAALQGSNGKPYADPDLDDPSRPRTLTANRAAKPLYEKGFVLFGNRQYEQSILVYQNFLTRYPDDIYSDNAQFWIGEAYLRMDKLVDAETAYRKVLKEYEHKSTLEGYKTPDAIYRIGQIYAKRSNEKLARYYLTQVVQRFPDSSAGRRAVRDLDNPASLTSQVARGELTAGG